MMLNELLDYPLTPMEELAVTDWALAKGLAP